MCGNSNMRISQAPPLLFLAAVMPANMHKSSYMQAWLEPDIKRNINTSNHCVTAVGGEILFTLLKVSTIKAYGIHGKAAKAPK